MDFNSQICTSREQSERLLALGLKKETADMCWNKLTLHGTPITYPSQDVWSDYSIISDIHFPAWSLHRLMEMVPFNLKDKKGYTYDFMIEDDNTISYYYFAEQSWYCNKYWGKNNLYDNFIDCIEWLIKEGYFNKEYLEV